MMPQVGHGYWALDNVAITDEVTRSGAPVLSNTEAPERGLFGMKYGAQPVNRRP